MKILTTLLFTSGDPATQGQILKMDTIEHDKQMWLVPEWIEAPLAGWKSPKRIILLDGLAHHKSGPPLADFVLDETLPKAVLDGRVPSELRGRFVVIEAPEITLTAPPRRH